ncbi:hypothetical protein Pelo_18417 [Pelomyxa schiedti]|nr:hypothetical protein Pelo_18417 [Pelomyxa schiedti]
MMQELFHGRGVTMAPPDHVAWAEHQFVAVCVGGIVGRCASASPLRVLPHHVLCHEIGRNWIMGVAKSVLVTLRDSSKGHNEALWFVCISHTLGVVSIECDFRKISACIYGWVGRHHVATPQGFWATATTSAIVETTKMQKVAEWDGTFLFSYTVVVSNRRWQLVYNSVGTKTVAIWPKPLPPATNSTISGRADFVRSVFIREAEHVQWIDATLGGSDANIVAFAVWTVHKQALWIVDLEKTYQQSVLSILQEVLLRSYDIFWGAKYGVIGAPHTQPLLNCPSQPNFMIDIDTKQAVRCFKWLGGKIDESHIYEVSSTGALCIFSATNTYTPCHVYQWSSDCRCIMDNGLIAFQGFHHVNLIDAVTGCSLWSQPVPTLTPQHVLTLQSL